MTHTKKRNTKPSGGRHTKTNTLAQSINVSIVGDGTPHQQGVSNAKATEKEINKNPIIAQE